MKTCWKRLAAVLCLAALLLVGCAKESGTADDTTARQAGSETEAPETDLPLTLVEKGKSSYTVVYPEDADTKVIRAARSLATALKSYTGADIGNQDDYLKKGETASEYEILVGLTNRPESTGVYKDLAAGEYTVRMVGKKLVILGGSNTGTSNAADYFVEKVLKTTNGLSAGTTDGTLIFTAEQNFTQRSKYNIRSLTLNGVAMSSFRMVIPADGSLESYFAKLLKRHLTNYAGINMEIVTDAGEAAEYEIRIGKTARTTGEVPQGKATVTVGEKSMEILWSSGFGFLAAYELICAQVFSNLQATIALKPGDSWEANESVPANVEKRGEMRIMYHNVWGYINADGSNPISMRPDVALSVYQSYQPDVLCLQECSNAYRTGGKALFRWLGENYTEVCFPNDGGTGNPIFYNNTLFEAVETGYKKARSGDKGTTWAVLRRKSDGKLFGVTNSHFAANTNAGDDPALGNEYRVQDAACMAQVAKSIVEKYGKISVFSGGDFNTNKSGDPYRTLTEAGLNNIRGIAEDCTTLSPYYQTFPYNADYDFYNLQNSLSADSEWAIDHLMYCGATPTVSRYDVVNYSLALVASDHAAHFADVTLPDVQDFREGDPNDLTRIDFDDLFN